MTSLLAAVVFLSAGIGGSYSASAPSAVVQSDLCSSDTALNACQAPPPAPSPPALPEGFWTRVEAGDTLSQLVAWAGASFDSTVATNQLANPDWIDVGRPLLLVGGHEFSRPAFSPTSPGPASTTLVARPQAPSTGNHFTFGYCTWYVANKRPIPWFGDAGQWGPNARAMGFPEGMAPRPGAVMVTWEGPVGHVAYVESVNPDGSWVVSEMNYNAWDVVDVRTVRPGTIPLEVFIY